MALLLGLLRPYKGIGLLAQAWPKVAATLPDARLLLVGDAAYYWRFGFSAEKTAALWMPGPHEPDRLLACELTPGTLDGARGMIGATGHPTPVPSLAALIAGLDRGLVQNLGRDLGREFGHDAASARHAA